MTLYIHRTTGEQREIDAALIAAWRSASNPKADAWALATPRPADTRIERYDDTAELIDGIWQQVWAARAATAEEQAEWDEAHRPPPDWKTFKRTLLGDQEINYLLGVGILNAPAAALALPATVINSSEGVDLSDFRAAWLALRRKGLISQELIQKVRMLAIRCNMSDDFLSSIGGTVRPSPQFVGQEWISSDGVLWVVVQAIDENGQFKSDDPNTQEKESLEWIIDA